MDRSFSPDRSFSLLIIGSVWPEPGSSAAGRRMMQLVSLFQTQEWEITFASPSAQSVYSINLEERGLKSVQTEINSAGFDDLVNEMQPSMVLFDRFITEEQFGWRVAEQCPGALRLLDTEDLHCLRRLRRRAVEEGRLFHRRDLLENNTARREIASILRSDLALIISDFEMGLLKNLFGVDASLLHYLPFLLSPVDKNIRQEWMPFEERVHFVTVGNFRHPPNWDAVQYLQRDIWPLIRRRLPLAELHVYGAYPPQRAGKLHSPETGFYIKGRADDAKSVVRHARVSLAPLRFGAGLKGKLVESMECGTPSVTTDIGAEGLAGNLPWNGVVAEDDANVFASAAARLYTDREAWLRAQQRGADIINRRFAKNQFSAGLMERLGNIRRNLQKHRRGNFMGGMLMHHTAASTKYMSKWIEEKNR